VAERRLASSMLSRITITGARSDNDVAQLTFEVCDGVSVFTNEAYASLDWGAAAATLRTFGEQIHGGSSTWRPAKKGLSTPAARSDLAFTTTSRTNC
jgi:hypothetical protein